MKSFRLISWLKITTVLVVLSTNTLCWALPLTPPLHTIEFDVTEGTFINVDVSQDGRTLVFDLLGDIYTLPITGGQATPLLSGRAWERCPRYSPDGRQIAFISDRPTLVGRNVENVWIFDLATKALHQVTNSKDLEKASLIRGTVEGTPTWLTGAKEIAFGLHDLR